MRVLVTGGQGFLGAWIVARLAAAGHETRIFDVGHDMRLVRAIAGHVPEWIVGDIADPEQVHAVAQECDAIIHLAGILLPACASNPIRGAQINLLGTLGVFEAARSHAISRIVYTSSASVFGPDDGLHPHPMTHYGAFKLACEGSARAYWADHGVPSIGFRPYIVYGPGRETGLTAGPTLACKAAARGQDYVIGYTGEAGLVYVDDVANAYVAAVLHEPSGAHVFSLAGEIASTCDVAAEIQSQIPASRISVDGPALPMPARLDEDGLAACLPGLATTPLADGIARTIAFYRQTER